VSPRLPFKKLLNGCTTDSILGSEPSVTPDFYTWALGLRRRVGPDRSNDFRSENRVFISGSSICSSAPFDGHIPQVVGVGANPQVSGITARRIVAGVTNTKSLWDVSVDKSEGDAVRQPVLAVNTEYSIPFFQVSRRPRPALCGTRALINLAPKSFSKFHTFNTSGQVN
jgi:hypothetical protein